LPASLSTTFFRSLTVQVGGTYLPDGETVPRGAVNAQRPPKPGAGHLERLEGNLGCCLPGLIGCHPWRPQAYLIEENLLASFRPMSIGLDVQENAQVLSAGVIIRQLEPIAIE
jgi:hypothetical protein